MNDIKRSSPSTCLIAAAALFLHATACATAVDQEAEKALIARVIDDHVGWFEEKDFDLLFSTMTNGPDLFMFQLDTSSTIRGFSEFQEYSVGWRNPEVGYAGHSVNDLRINLSQWSDAAWFSAQLEDCADVRGNVRCLNTRWTGVLEKRQGRWIIVQEHYSLPVDLSSQANVGTMK